MPGLRQTQLRCPQALLLKRVQGLHQLGPLPFKGTAQGGQRQICGLFLYTRPGNTGCVSDLVQALSRFVSRRIEGNKPAEDLKNLVLQFGQEWHHIVNNNGSRSYASLCLVNQNHSKDIQPSSIRPDRKSLPRLSRHETRCLEMLKLKRADLSDDGRTVKIKSAYKRMAKVHHPDVGGDEEAFKKLNDAHAQMLLWAENPHYTSRKSLPGCWSYDGATSRWSPPL